MTTTAEKIAVMQAWEDGYAVEAISRATLATQSNPVWLKVPTPIWDWFDVAYRIAVTKPSINWDHVSPDYNWLARDKSDGPDLNCFLYTGKPLLSPWEERWGILASAKYASAEGFASLDRGTCDWKDSLVMRPGYEGD